MLRIPHGKNEYKWPKFSLRKTERKTVKKKRKREKREGERPAAKERKRERVHGIKEKRRKSHTSHHEPP